MPSSMAMASEQNPRFAHWVAFFVFSTITLGATIEAQAHSDRLSPAAKTNQKWAVACSSITFILSCIVVHLHTKPVLSTLVTGTQLEGFLILILLCFWSALVAVVSDTRHGLATDATGAVSNGNLYYFSWAGFASGFALGASYLRTYFGVDLAGEVRTRSARLSYWAALAATGLVEMGSAARIYDNHCTYAAVYGGDVVESVTFCRRTRLGIALGCISAVAAVAIAGAKVASSRFPFAVEGVASVLLVLAHAFGVSFVTSKEGPGAPLNNLYYSSWGAFVACLFLVVSCVRDFTEARREDAEAQRGEVFDHRDSAGTFSERSVGGVGENSTSEMQHLQMEGGGGEEFDTSSRSAGYMM